MQAQLGQQANINLGGYIPAAAQKTKLWQQVLAQFLGNAASQATGAAIDVATAPDVSKVNAQSGAVSEDYPMYRRKPTGADVAALRGAEVSNKRAGIEEKGVNAHIRQGDTKLDLEGKRTDADIRQGDEKLELGRGSLLLDRARGDQQALSDERRFQLATQELGLAKEKFKQSGKESDRDYMLKKERLLAELLGQSFDQKLQTGKLNLAAADSERENALLPYKQEALSASAGSRNAYAGLSTEKQEATQLANQWIREMRVKSIMSDAKLTSQQKEAAVKAILSGAGN
jgi:hypothetical protein